MNLGMALAMGGHEAEALAPLERAIALKPDLIPAHLFLGSSYLALGKADKAVAPLEAGVAARPADIEQPPNARAGVRRRPAVKSTRSTQLRRITELAPAFRRGGMHSATRTTPSRRTRWPASTTNRSSRRGVSCCWPTRSWPTAG